ncbi:MAG: hydroxyacylglutathione hydrolase [Pseudomonadota bacterium]|nr:hydroxyacylglutathione hydrolase [Pseudomonadota bacterium]
MSFVIDVLPALADNYIYLVSDSELGLAMVVDPGDANAVLPTLKERDLHLTLILNTHHHHDNTAGSRKLQKEYGPAILGPDKERSRIDGMSRGVVGGDLVTFSTLRGQVIETHGHTAGHIAFYFPQLKALFCGDALFSLGCGRLIEGTAAEMWAGLVALRNLPNDTMIYCSHEYTEANAKFALAVDGKNEALKRRSAEATALRGRKLPTVPVPLGLEKQTNPFLRIDQPEFRTTLAAQGLPAHDVEPAALFGLLRSARDTFKGAETAMG